MPKDGVEPSWDCSRQILSLVRIPISPLRHELKMIKLFRRARQEARLLFPFSPIVSLIAIDERGKKVAVDSFYMLNFVGCLVAPKYLLSV